MYAMSSQKREGAKNTKSQGRPVLQYNDTSAWCGCPQEWEWLKYQWNFPEPSVCLI